MSESVLLTRRKSFSVHSLREKPVKLHRKLFLVSLMLAVVAFVMGNWFFLVNPIDFTHMLIRTFGANAICGNVGYAQCIYAGWLGNPIAVMTTVLPTPFAIVALILMISSFPLRLWESRKSINRTERTPLLKNP